MGTWGPGIFSDDLASDLRAEYRDLVGDGLSGEEATRRLLAEWQPDLDDPDVGPVFWLALAATQWKVGRLEERVKRELPRARITRLGIRTPPHCRYSERGPCHFTLWRWIDQTIAALYGLE